MRLFVALFSVTFPLTVVAQAAPQVQQSDALVQFTARVENIGRKALKLSNGDTIDMQVSPVIWVVHRGQNPFFTPGEIEGGHGLKPAAESGRPAPLLIAIANRKSPDTHLLGFENIAVGAERPGMLNAGQSYEFTFDARPGDRLSVMMMLAESNDGLIATGPRPIELFRGNRPVSGDVSDHLSLWDAGTEVNEDPGLGRNTGRRQGAPHAGDPERNPVKPMNGVPYGDVWPAPNRILRITVTPAKSP